MLTLLTALGLFDTEATATPPSNLCTFRPVDANHIVTADGDIFRVICAGIPGTGRRMPLILGSIRRKIASFRDRL